METDRRVGHGEGGMEWRAYVRRGVRGWEERSRSSYRELVGGGRTARFGHANK